MFNGTNCEYLMRKREWESLIWKQKDVDMEMENGAVSVILAKARIVHGVSLFTACKPSSFLIKTLTVCVCVSVCVSGGSNIFQDCPSVIFMLLVFFFFLFFCLSCPSLSFLSEWHMASCGSQLEKHFHSPYSASQFGLKLRVRSRLRLSLLSRLTIAIRPV